VWIGLNNYNVHIALAQSLFFKCIGKEEEDNWVSEWKGRSEVSPDPNWKSKRQSCESTCIGLNLVSLEEGFHGIMVRISF